MWNLISIVALIGGFLYTLIGEEIKGCLVDLIKEKIGVVPWIKEHVGYVIDYGSNMKTLKTEVDSLGKIQNEAQHSVDEASRKGQVIAPGLDSLLTKADRSNEEVKKMLEDEVRVNKRWLGGWCPDLISRYNLSKEAKTKTEHVRELQEEINRLTFVDFESRMSIMKDIMAALKDDDIRAIGICGSGGVGKTTMVQKIRKGAEAEKLFDENVMVVVSQNQDKEKIQEEIGKKLGLASFDKMDFYKRADALRERLKNGKRVLIILDDVWERLELDKVGIPDRGVCKVVVTSRSQHACHTTGIRERDVFTIKVLDKEEAWNLFKQEAGDSIGSPDLNEIAREVVEECRGLPIAIVTVGAALKGKKKPGWRDALQQLKKSNPENIPEMLERVYPSIMLSYDFLGSQEAKSCLLLCCLFEEDANIRVEGLFRIGVGLHLFKDVDTLEQARDRVHTLVEKLKGSFLLLEGYKEESVRVHDVVRDVIRFVARQGKQAFMFGDGQELKEWPTVSTREADTTLSLISNKIHGLPDRLDGPKIELLLLQCRGGSRSEVPDDLFEGTKELKVLNLKEVDFIPSPPPSLSFLTELRTLRLHSCQLENISAIGQLKALVILSFRNSSIKKLPQEIGNLTHLRLLDLTKCDSIETVTPGVISSLKRLEELYLRNSGLRWVVEEEEGNAENKVNLNELLSLSQLTTLETCLPTTKFPRGINPFGNLQRFGIVINPGENWNWEREHEFRNELKLNLDTRIPIDDWINVLLKKTEALHLTLKGVKNVLNDLTPQNLIIELKSLTLTKCEGLEYLIDTVDLLPNNVFPNLESLKISEVVNLKAICHSKLPARSFRELTSLYLYDLRELIHLWKDPTEVVSLPNLSHVEVKRCDRLENLFSQSIASGLEQLKVLQIENCKEIKEIVATERGEHGEATDKIRFPKLSELTLVELPEFRSFCPNNLISEGNHDIATQHLFNEKNIGEGDADLALTHLKILRLKSLPKLTHLWEMGTPGIQGFQNLQCLEVEDCQSLKYIFTPSIAKLLVKLEELCIINCAIVEIVGKDQEGREEIEEATKVIQFPQLNKLRLTILPDFVSFGAKPYTFKWPVLKELFVDNSGMKVLIPTFQGVGKQKTITMTSREEVHEQQIIFPSLEVLTLDGEEGVEGILHGRLLAHSFCNLRKLCVKKCNKLLVVPSNWLLAGLQKQEALTIRECASLVEVFEVEGLNVEERDAALLPMLKDLRLGYLPKLKRLFDERLLFPTCLFPNLKLLEVWDCGNLRNLFSPSMAGALVHLEKLLIENCEMMEEIVVKGENEEADKTNKIVIPQFKSLHLYSLPNLKSFCQSPYAFDLPLLEGVHVHNCPKMKAFSMGNLSTPKLQKVKGVWMGDLNNTIQELFKRERKQIIFPSLEVLRLEGEDNVEGILDGQLLAHSLCNLRQIRVRKCNQLLAVPSNWLPAGLQKLEDLTIDDCASLVEVFEVQGLNVEERDAVLLPMLKELCLWGLPKLERLLKEKLLYPTCLFSNLEFLHVWNCGNLRNLFPPSMARALVHLRYLTIENCEMMEEIVVKGENEEADRRDKIVIPQLQSLSLYSLPNLTSFCQSPYAFDLPLLEDVWGLHNCPKMKAFSMGNVSAPKLQKVGGVWTRDLNKTIQELFERKRKELEVDQEIGQEEHLVKELEVNQEIEQEEHLFKESEVNQQEHLVKELEVNQEVGQEEHLDNNDDDHEN